MKKTNLLITSLVILLALGCSQKSSSKKNSTEGEKGGFSLLKDTFYKENSVEISKIKRTFYINNINLSSDESSDYLIESYSLRQELGDSMFTFEMIKNAKEGIQLTIQEMSLKQLNEFFSRIETCINNPGKNLSFNFPEDGDYQNTLHPLDKGKAYVFTTGTAGTCSGEISKEDLQNMRDCLTKYLKEK